MSVVPSRLRVDLIRRLGFAVCGLGFEVWSLGFKVWGLGFRVWGLGFRVSTQKYLADLAIHSTYKKNPYVPWDSLP